FPLRRTNQYHIFGHLVKPAVRIPTGSHGALTSTISSATSPLSFSIKSNSKIRWRLGRKLVSKSLSNWDICTNTVLYGDSSNRESVIQRFSFSLIKYRRNP